MSAELDVVVDDVAAIDSAAIAEAAAVADLQENIDLHVEVGLMMIVTEPDGKQRVIRAPVELTVEMLPRAVGDHPGVAPVPRE